MNDKPEFQMIAEKSAGHELLEALIAEIRNQKRPWASLMPDEQNEVIDRLRGRVVGCVDLLVRAIIAHGRGTIRARVKSVSFADDIKATLGLTQGNALVHELADRAGSDILITLVDPDEHAAGVENVKGDAVQVDFMDGEGA